MMASKVLLALAAMFAFGSAYHFTWKDGSLGGLPYRYRREGLAWTLAFVATGCAAAAFLMWG